NRHMTGYSSISFNNILSLISIFSHKSRFYDNKIENIIGFNMGFLREKTHGGSLSTEAMESIATDIQDVKIPQKKGSERDGVSYTLPMKEVLIHLGKYDETREVIRHYILDFYHNIYLPIYNRTTEVSMILDMEFEV
ncbi:TPA: hypothetical protein ACVOYS_004700, partial [Vibrio alginolyticus]